jgi:hypothetical protein
MVPAKSYATLDRAVKHVLENLENRENQKAGKTPRSFPAHPGGQDQKATTLRAG